MSCHHRSRPSVHPHVGAGAPHHQDVLHAVLAVDRLVGRFFQRYRAAAAILPVGGDQQLGLGVFDAGAQRGSREPGEHDAVHHPEPCAGQHRDDRFGHHRHVDRDTVAGFEAEIGQRVGRFRHVGQQLRVRQGAAVTEGFAFPVDRDAVAVAGQDVAVHAVVGHVELAADEPFRERRARPVEHVGERSLPGQPVRLLRPEAQPVALGRLVKVGGGIGLLRRIPLWAGTSTGHQRASRSWW